MDRFTDRLTHTERYANETAVLSVEDPVRHTYTYAELDRMANQVAFWAQEKQSQQPQPQPRLRVGDVVALLLPNVAVYPAFTLGLAKCGVTVACVNYNLSGRLLAHALRVANVKCCIVASQYYGHSWSTMRTEVPETWEHYRDKTWVYCCPSSSSSSLAEEQEQQGQQGQQVEGIDAAERLHWNPFAEVDPRSTMRPPKGIRSTVGQRDPFLYIYTSGTTGPSKAAKFSHRRWIGCGLTWARPSLLERGQRYYITLPLYHGNGGAVALSAIFYSGCTAVIRSRFSASQFFADIRRFQVPRVMLVVVSL